MLSPANLLITVNCESLDDCCYFITLQLLNQFRINLPERLWPTNNFPVPNECNRGRSTKYLIWNYLFQWTLLTSRRTVACVCTVSRTPHTLSTQWSRILPSCVLMCTRKCRIWLALVSISRWFPCHSRCCLSLFTRQSVCKTMHHAYGLCGLPLQNRFTTFTNYSGRLVWCETSLFFIIFLGLGHFWLPVHFL